MSVCLDLCECSVTLCDLLCGQREVCFMTKAAGDTETEPEPGTEPQNQNQELKEAKKLRVCSDLVAS